MEVNEITVGDTNEKEDNFWESNENPLWSQNNDNGLYQEENVVEVSNAWEVEIGQESNGIMVEPPQKPKEEYKLNDNSNLDLPVEGHNRKCSQSNYDVKSLNFRSEQSRCQNPFQNFQNIEDFKYYIRGDSQILFSIWDIDSKNLDIFSIQKIEENKSPNSNSNSDFENENDNCEFQIEDWDNWLKFIKNTFKKYKKKRKHRMILRVNNIEEGVGETRRKYDRNWEFKGVNIKNYLRGVSVDLKIQKRYFNNSRFLK